jgi:hypothetical protein
MTPVGILGGGQSIRQRVPVMDRYDNRTQTAYPYLMQAKVGFNMTRTSSAGASILTFVCSTLMCCEAFAQTPAKTDTVVVWGRATDLVG